MTRSFLCASLNKRGNHDDNNGQDRQHTIRRVLDAKRQQPWALRPILPAIQHEPGHVPPAAMPEIADGLA